MGSLSANLGRYLFADCGGADGSAVGQMALDEQLEEMTAWAQSGPGDEYRFTLFFVPYVIKKEDQYLVAYRGMMPERKKMHLALIPMTKSGTTPEEAYEWVKRSGIFGLMSGARQSDFAKTFKEWWARPEERDGNDTPTA